MTREIEVWEDDGGKALLPLSGTPGQVQWAERIRESVNEDFDRVARLFVSVSFNQSAAKRADTEAILKILEEKRAAVMSSQQAGYFIREWQEITDQVRNMISQDPRFKAIQHAR